MEIRLDLLRLRASITQSKVWILTFKKDFKTRVAFMATELEETEVGIHKLFDVGEEELAYLSSRSCLAGDMEKDIFYFCIQEEWKA